VLLSCEEDFVSITCAFVCLMSQEDDGIRPSTFSLPDLPFASDWTGKLVPSDMGSNKAMVL